MPPVVKQQLVPGNGKKNGDIDEAVPAGREKFVFMKVLNTSI